MSDRTRRLAAVACAVCLVVGSAARIWGYLSSGSLWLDELFIANNLRELTFTELLGPLKYGQNAPVAWLLLQKAVITVFGESERALRFPALMASLLSLPLTWVVARRVLGTAYSIIPVAVVCFSPFVVWQGLQVKQYSFDLLVALGILALALRAQHGPGRTRAALGCAGFLGIWFSMPAIFVTAGVGLVLFASALRDQPRDRNRLRALVAIGVAWAAAFTANDILFLRSRSQGEWLYEYWSPGLFSWPIDRWDDLSWLPRILSAAMSEPVGFGGIGAFALIPVLAGVALLGRRTTASQRTSLGLLGLPILLALAAAILNLYPFTTRLVVFLVPSFAILFAFGVQQLIHLVPRMRPWLHAATTAMLAVPILVFLVWLPQGGFPIAVETQALFRHLEQEMQPGDKVVVEHIASHAWRFYAATRIRNIIEAPPAWTPAERAQTLRETLEPLDHPRLWVVMSRVERAKPQTMIESFSKDFANQDPRLPETYHWFFVRPAEWVPLEWFQHQLPAAWQIKKEILVNGGCLWLLERRRH